MRQRDRPAEFGRRGLLVALLAGLQTLLDGGGEFGLARVVRYPRVDLGGQRLVVSPYRADEPLPEDLGAGRCACDQADPRGQHLLTHAGRVDLDADVVVPALPRTPRPCRVVTR